ncbi:MAG TPA: hypothetical protein VE863_09385 [Pyrinomonadaceae bacterium]|jgi:hypothetical protein|nr:hypothetical protein [Pyrinomonadaceae bacterium]
MAVERTQADEKSRTVIIIVVAVIAAVLIGGFFYLLMRKSAAPNPPATLQSAIRAGSTDWDKYSKLIALDDPEADESKRALGDTVMTLFTTVRNFTGRTITGLEMRAAVVDHAGKPVKQRTVVMIPGRQAELDPNKTMRASILIDGFTDEDDRANIKMEVTGFTLR